MFFATSDFWNTHELYMGGRVMIDDPNIPPKAESEGKEHSNEKRYWRSPLIDRELDIIESERKKDPDKLRMKLIEDRNFLWSLKPETLLEVIDQYYELNDEDAVNSLCDVLVQKGLMIMKFFLGSLSSDLDKLDLKSHTNYAIWCMVENRKVDAFARCRFATVLGRKVIDEFKKSSPRNKYRDFFVTLEEADVLIYEERRLREGVEIPLIEKLISDREIIDALLGELKIDQIKKRAFLMRNLGGLEYKDIALYFHKKPDTIRKWCDEVKKLLSRIARKV